MAYTILKSNGTVLTTIADGTINTTSTPLGLPGRNYAGYGQVLDTNVVHLLENFADSVPPSNPLQGQLWFDTNTNTLKLCPSDGEAVAANWYSISSTSANGQSVFASVAVTGNLTANNANITNTLDASYINCIDLSSSGNANLTIANIANTITTYITTGGGAGNIYGSWTFNNPTNLGPIGNVTITGGSNGQYLQTDGNGALTWSTVITSTIANGSSNVSIPVASGNVLISAQSNANVLVVSGVGANITGVLNASGNITGANVIATNRVRTANITTGAAATAGNITGNWTFTSGSQLITPVASVADCNVTTILRTTTITTGAFSTAGTITGNWTLTSGSRLQSTYADVAERFESDTVYEAGTVVEIGGDKEITAVKYDLSDDVFGVVSNTAAYLLNSAAGDDATHPAVAMSGRVKVNVTGQIKKGDRLVSAGNGTARAAKPGEATAFNTIGRSLEDKQTAGQGQVLAIVTIK